MDIMMNAALYFNREDGPFEMVVTANHETWGVKGDTWEELFANARKLRDKYALSDDQIMAMESDEELETACQDEKTANEIYERVREWYEWKEEERLEIAN